MDENANNEVKILDGNRQEETGGNPETVATPIPGVVPAVTKKKKKKKIGWIILGVAVVAVVAVVYFNAQRPTGSFGTGNYSLSEVARRDITVALSGSGTLEPADSYIVTGLVEGEVLEDTFEEGDVVNKDDLLYHVDNSTAAKNIERAEMSLSQSEKTYQRLLDNLDNLNVKSTESGTVTELSVEVGDDVTAGQKIATVRNSSIMSLEIPFAADDTLSFAVGSGAQVTVDGSFETVNGTISKISGVDETIVGNMIVRNVTIDVSNPGGITVGQSATAAIGDIACSASGVFAYKGEATISAKAAGKVARIIVDEGGYVRKNESILTLSSDTLSDQVSSAADSIKDAKLTLEDRYDLLENYMITSPISGTIIEKTYKAGDTYKSGNALCTIYDLSYLKMTLNVDELDINNVSVGQKVAITAEALANKTFDGVVTKVNISGNTSNGVTSYPVTIRIDKTDGLLPGMNVDAEIVIEGVENVLSVPISAVTRGNQVLVRTDPAADGTQMGEDGIPVGFKYIEVETGVSDDSFIEIKSGLEEGQTVALVRVASQGNFFMMPDGGVMTVGPGGQAGTVRQGPGGNVTTVTRVGG